MLRGGGPFHALKRQEARQPLPRRRPIGAACRDTVPALLDRRGQRQRHQGRRLQAHGLRRRRRLLTARLFWEEAVSGCPQCHQRQHGVTHSAQCKTSPTDGTRAHKGTGAHDGTWSARWGNAGERPCVEEFGVAHSSPHGRSMMTEQGSRLAKQPQVPPPKPQELPLGRCSNKTRTGFQPLLSFQFCNRSVVHPEGSSA